MPKSQKHKSVLKTQAKFYFDVLQPLYSDLNT